MAYSDLIKQLKEIIADVHSTDIEFSAISNVPNVNTTQNLTFESGDVKRGRTIKTCVLYVDIRDSVRLNEEKQTKTMGRIYTAFTKAVLFAARNDGGCVRNIIGDRVMVVFPEKECFQHAVHCAFSINHIATLINNQFPTVDFKCGIGIDYGTMNVLKVGIDVRDDEKQEYRNLVWVGYPANYASRLTDVANKTVTERYKIKGQSAFSIRRTDSYDEYIFSKDDLLSSLKVSYNGLTPMPFSSVSSIEPIKHTFPPILISEVVYKGYVKEASDDNSIKNNWWKVQNYPIKDISFPVYGADVIWKV